MIMNEVQSKDLDRSMACELAQVPSHDHELSTWIENLSQYLMITSSDHEFGKSGVLKNMNVVVTIFGIYKSHSK